MTKSRSVRNVGVVAPKAITDNAVKLDRARVITEFKSLPDKVARSSFKKVNELVPALRDVFMWTPSMWKVDFFYPHAEGGPVYIDMPTHPYNVEQCIRKAKVMKTAGLAYVYLEQDATLNDALERLGRL